jgi:MFS family permease
MGASLSLLRRHRHFRSLWLADFISGIGDWFSLVAVCTLGSAAARDEGSALVLATVLASHMLPQAVLAPLAGWLADRLDRQRVLLSANLIQGALTMAMVVAAAVHSFAAVQVLLLVRSSVSALREPAAGAALPRLVPSGELATANALGAATWSVTFVVGMALGGLAAEIGPAFALAADALSFFFASALVARLPALKAIPRQPRRLVPMLLEDVREAVRALHDRDLFAATFAKAPVSLAAGAAWMALNLVAHDRAFAGRAAATLGFLQAARGIGTGVGPFVARVLAGRFGERALLHASAAAVGIAAIALSTAEGPLGALLSVLLWGMGGGAVWVLTMTGIQRHSADAVRGRMLAVDTFGFAIGMSASALVTGAAVDAGIPLRHVTVGIVAVSAVAAGWIFGRTRRATIVAAHTGV